VNEETDKENYHAFLRDKILKLQGKSFPQARDVHPTLTVKFYSYRIAASERPKRSMVKAMMNQPDNFNEERYFGEFRRKVKAAEVLSASMERLLLSLRFTGKVSVGMRNGRVLKSGYEEEGYFRQRDSACVDDEIAHNL
jgi:hypothetical protein